MAHFTTYAKISTSAPTDGGQQFNIKVLHPFDRMKVLLEQAIYASYLLTMVGPTSTVRSLIQNVRSAYVNEPNEWANISEALSSLYKIGMEAIPKIVNFHEFAPMPTDLAFEHAEDIWAIFNQENMKDYVNKEYTPTITESFLIGYMAHWCGWHDATANPTGTSNNVSMLIPAVYTVKAYSPYVNTEMSKEYDQVITFIQKDMGEFELNKVGAESKNVTSPYGYLNRFNMKDYTADSVIGLMASFALDHDIRIEKYVMTDLPGGLGFRIADVCFDLVTGSSHVQPDPAGGSKMVVDHLIFINFLEQKIKANQLGQVQDPELFGELLNRLGESRPIVEYFRKPVSLISAEEAYAFRNSDLKFLMEDKFTPGMEADALDVPEDEESTDPEATPTDNSEGLVSDDASAEQEKPQIDPKMMLLELAEPTESMADYIYREMVARRIEMILKNPPENALPNDLLMLKRWRSRWLYLASIACLRDFLTRVSIRLS